MKRFREISKVDIKKGGGIKIGYVDFNMVSEPHFKYLADFFPYCGLRVWL